MRVIPIGVRELAAIGVLALLPAVPLAATVMPLGEIVKRLLHLLV